MVLCKSLVCSLFLSSFVLFLSGCATSGNLPVPEQEAQTLLPGHVSLGGSFSYANSGAANTLSYYDQSSPSVTSLNLNMRTGLIKRIDFGLGYSVAATNEKYYLTDYGKDTLFKAERYSALFLDLKFQLSKSPIKFRRPFLSLAFQYGYSTKDNGTDIVSIPLRMGLRINNYFQAQLTEKMEYLSIRHPNHYLSSNGYQSDILFRNNLALNLIASLLEPGKDVWVPKITTSIGTQFDMLHSNLFSMYYINIGVSVDSPYLFED